MGGCLGQKGIGKGAGEILPQCVPEGRRLCPAPHHGGGQALRVGGVDAPQVPGVEAHGSGADEGSADVLVGNAILGVVHHLVNGAIQILGMQGHFSAPLVAVFIHIGQLKAVGGGLGVPLAVPQRPLCPRPGAEVTVPGGIDVHTGFVGR